MDHNFSQDLNRFGPETPRGPTMTVRQAEEYCRRLARRHYENFTVASFLLPRPLRRHFCNVYAYCRWADDLADETGDPQRSRTLLDWWEGQLLDCYQGRAAHPVFIALKETIDRFQIPVEPFGDLLVAFRQDQQVTRYETFDDLLTYCRYSANPVGRLVLYVGECFSEENARLADSICTGLQLANFCQDVARDWRRGRIYLPQADCRQYGYPEAMFAGGECNDAFRRLLRAQVDRAEGFFHSGRPLIALLPPALRLDVALFLHGGLAILRAVRRQDFDVWTRRPTVGKLQKLGLLFRCWRELKKR
ncbi:MAG: squalene synthase HpnC [Pirellulales bacterium]|nr:squalene synthase HpnC [Pirellulales bacterium]